MIALLLLACTGETEDSGAVTPCEAVSGSICVWAGTGEAGWAPEILPLLETRLYFPMDAEIAEGKPDIIIDWNNNVVRQVLPDGTIAPAIGTGFAGDGPPDFSDNEPGGAPGTATALNHPTDASWLPNGDLLISVWHNHKLRTWNPDSGYVHVLGGAEVGFAGDGGDVVDALFSQPHSAVSDELGTIYVVDMRNGRLRYITPDGVIDTLGGDGTQGFAGDGGPVSAAVFNFPTGAAPRPGGSVALDGRTLYVSDTLNHRIRAVNLDTGTITTVVGTGVAGFAGDDGPAINAQLNNPIDIEVFDEKLFIADTNNCRVRVVDLQTGVISTIAGTGESTWTGDGGPALEATLNYPHGVALSPDGRLFIADTYNHVIRVVYP